MRLALTFVLTVIIAGTAYSQRKPIQYFRNNDISGLNVYETPKDDTVAYEGFRVRVGADFALQFQALNQVNAANSLVELGSNFNLPNANFNIDAQLLDGMRLHLRTYLSSRHHEEAYVKGGYIQVDKLEFIREGFLENIMQYATLRVGMDEFNYGDTRFRRSDNANVIFNPFVGNYLMDAFSTEVFGEVWVQYNGLIAVVGLTNGKLNQSVVVDSTSDNKPSFFGKIGYDKQFNEDFRFRITGSWYLNKGTTTGTWLYGGDRAGSRYYNVMRDLDEGGSDFEGRFNPRFRQMTALQFTPSLQWKGLEFFGLVELVMNSEDQGNGSYTQLGAELLYRFGKRRNFYAGARYNNVSGEDREGAETKTINRFNIGGGWFITKNVLAKVEYVTQEYKDAGWAGSKYDGASFDGIVIEAAISF